MGLTVTSLNYNTCLSHDSVASHWEVAQSSLNSASNLGLLAVSQLSSLLSGELSSLIKRLVSLLGELSLGGGSSLFRLNSENASDRLSDMLDLGKFGTSTTGNLGDAELSELALQLIELLSEILLVLSSKLVSLDFDHDKSETKRLMSNR